MKRKSGISKLTTPLLLLVFGAIGVVAYQNCANSTAFTTTEESKSSGDVNRPVVPQFATKVAGDADSFPPLKLLFVVDNSGTMEVNQINLATAFDRMFAGTNETNLAPFETTAMLISTSQKSPNLTDSVFSRLPVQTAEQFAALTPADLDRNRVPKLNGLIPGDLVGFGLGRNVYSDRTVTSFTPAPVTLFRPVSGGPFQVSRSVYKAQNGSVSDFANDFKERLALLNPAKSAINSTTKRGILDEVIDKESGLCAVARILKQDQSFLRPGDLASIVIVSDEEDSDPSGRACYESIIEAKSGVNYVDGRCESDQTYLGYRPAVLNPSKAKCKVDYQTGFSYRIDYKMPTVSVDYYTRSQKYDQLQTNVTYYTSWMQYTQLRTSVSYFTSKMTYDAIETPVTYYTKSPTYSVPRTTVQYFTEVEDCAIRDGIKTNCEYSYPAAAPVTLEGDFKGNCAAFVAGKLPSGALYDKPGYLPACSSAAPVAKTGACSASNLDILDCKQNYSAPQTVRLAGKITSTCDAFWTGRLPSGALSGGTGETEYKPSCGTLISTAKEGTCNTTDKDKDNCKTVYTAATAPAILNGVPGTKTCNEFANGRLPAGAVYGVAGFLPTCGTASSVANVIGKCSATDTNISDCKTMYSTEKTKILAGRIPTNSTCEATFKSGLPTDTVFGNTAYPINCSNGTTVTGVTGTCSPTDPNVVNCNFVYSAKQNKSLDGALGSKSCADFVANRLPTGTTYTDAGYLPSCTTGTARDANVTGTESYTTWGSFAATLNGACSDDVRNGLVTSRGLVVASGTIPTCKVTSLSTGSQTFSSTTSDLTCTTAAWREVCTNSAGARKNCASTDIAAGDKYEPAKTVVLPGKFTCATLCSQTSFCKDKSGTIADNYYQCTVSTAPALVKSTFVLQPETGMCGAGENRVITRAPYKTDEVRPTYVAGSRSEANSPTALAEYIVERSREIFKEALPILSVFVRQPGDALGTNGSLGLEYNRLTDMLGGKKLSVLGNSTQYASALGDLSAKIRQRLGQSISFREVAPNQQIRNVWFRAKGAAEFTPLEKSVWSASGGTITVNSSMAFTYGDEFKIEYW